MTTNEDLQVAPESACTKGFSFLETHVIANSVLNFKAGVSEENLNSLSAEL